MEKIIEEITTLRFPFNPNDPSGIRKIQGKAYNRAIKDVLKIIKKRVEVKNQPTEEGLWIKNEDGEWLPCHVEDFGNGCFHVSDSGHPARLDKNREADKWFKIIIPKE